jgi:hypothetical protein
MFIISYIYMDLVVATVSSLLQPPESGILKAINSILKILRGDYRSLNPLEMLSTLFFTTAISIVKSNASL